MIISTPLSCCSITYSAAQLLIATAQLAYPNYVATVWHVYLVYVAMMFLSYVIICLPTKYVSWFNIWATMLGIVVLIVMTILLPAKATNLNSAKDIFTIVRFFLSYLSLSLSNAKFAGVQPDRLAVGLGVLHDVPVRDVDIERVRRRSARRRGDEPSCDRGAARDGVEHMVVGGARIPLSDLARAVLDGH